MKKLNLLIVATLMAGAAMAQNATDTLILRIKAMRCEECAHNVGLAMKATPGVKRCDFNLERRTVTITYDPQQTGRDTICARLLATRRYRPSAYDPKTEIRRGMGMYMAELKSEADGERIKKHLYSQVGLDSVGVHMDKKWMFIRYDANKTCKADIRKALMDIDVAPTAYYTSKIISHVQFSVPKKQATAENEELTLGLDGVDDVCLHPKTCVMTITYVNTETNPDKLIGELKEMGIEAKKN